MFGCDYTFAWLGILGHVPPSTERLIYARSHRGVALPSLGSPEIGQLGLQCTPAEDPSQWSDDRIWDELLQRFAVPEWTLKEGTILAGLR